MKKIFIAVVVMGISKASGNYYTVSCYEFSGCNFPDFRTIASGSCSALFGSNWRDAGTEFRLRLDGEQSTTTEAGTISGVCQRPP
jgi:hypothetical protein